MRHDPGVTLIPLAALGVAAGSSVVLWYYGQRFTRRHVLIHGSMPRLTWMFRRADDAELEGLRHTALGLLAVDLIAIAVYLSQG